MPSITAIDFLSSWGFDIQMCVGDLEEIKDCQDLIVMNNSVRLCFVSDIVMNITLSKITDLLKSAGSTYHVEFFPDEQEEHAFITTASGKK